MRCDIVKVIGFKIIPHSERKCKLVVHNSSNHSAIMLNPPFLSFFIYAYGRLETDFVIKRMVRGRTVLLMIKEMEDLHGSKRLQW